MNRALIRINLFLRRTVCRLLGHRKRPASVGSIGVLHCGRCHRVTDQRTVRRRLTHGDIERQLSAWAGVGNRLNYINWKKHTAHLTDAHGKAFTVQIPSVV